MYEDSQWQAKTAVSLFTKFTTIDKVDLIYNWGNPTSEAVAPIAEQNKVPALLMTLDPSSVRGKKYVIRTINSAEDFGRILAKWISATKYKKLGVVIAQNTYVQGIYEGAAKRSFFQPKPRNFGNL